MNLLRAAEDEQRPELPDDGDDEAEELLTYEDMREAVIGALPKLDRDKYRDDVDYIVQQGLAGKCNTQAAMRDWLSRQLVLTRRSGFQPPNAKYFPEPEIVQLVKYLRFAERARQTG